MKRQLLSLTIASLISVCLHAQDMKISIYPDTLHRINHKLFGHFLERPSWGGEAGIEDAVLAKTGKLDTRVEQKLRDLNIPVLRFPGGTDVDYMDWTDMIDLPGRPKRPISVGHVGDSVTNYFGLDEFAQLVEELDCEAIVPLNFFDAFLRRVPLDSAALQVERMVAYTNGMEGGDLPRGLSKWSALRTANGHPRPFKFKYFQIGNETWALWSWKKSLLDAAHIPNAKAWYVECVVQYVDMIEAIDPEVEILVDYVDDELLTALDSTLGDRIDYYVFHSYLPWAIKPENIRRNGQAMDQLQLDTEEVWNAFVSVPNELDETGMSSFGHPLLTKARVNNLKIAVTEWNWNGWWQSIMPRPLESRFAQAVGVAGFLHALMRNGDVIEMGCQSMLVGSRWGITGIRVAKDSSRDPYYLPTSEMTSFYADHHGDYLMRMHMDEMMVFRQPLQLSGIASKPLVAQVDAIATGSNDDLTIFLINRDFSDGKEVQIDLTAFQKSPIAAKLHTMSSVLKDVDVPPSSSSQISVHIMDLAPVGNRIKIDLPKRSVNALQVKF